MMSFNLVDEPWVPVRGADGAALVSLRQALTEPERFAGLDTDEVDEFFGLLRLLTTVLNRAFMGPRTDEHWAEIAYRDGYDVAAVHAYLDRWRHRFELFDEERPFLQFPEIASRKRTTPLSLLPSASSGNGITLFSHHCDHDGIALTPAAAARALVHAVVNGRGKLQGGEYGVFGARVAVLGPSLRDLLVDNLPRYGGSAAEGVPVWERDVPRRLPDSPRNELQPCYGLLDFSTWQWRAVLLFLDDDGWVRRCAFSHGLKPDGEEPHDPARWYVYATDDNLAKSPGTPLRTDKHLSVSRLVWRDADALLATLARKDHPSVLSWNTDCREGDLLDVVVGGPIVGKTSNGPARVTGVLASHLPLPRAVLADPHLVSRVADAIAECDRVSKDLCAASSALARELVRPTSVDTPSRHGSKKVPAVLDPLPGFWASLPAHFNVFLRAVSSGTAVDEWRDAVVREARRALDETISGLASTPRAMRAAAAARRQLRGVEGRVHDRATMEVTA